MDKTERLFAVMDALRRHRRPITAQALADEQGVSVRTLYRDIQTLIGLGAPIDGEAGIGYMLKQGFFLPPLMFSPEELEALVLGAQWVEGQPDVGLRTAAKNALGKIATASPEDLRDRISNTGLWAAQASWSVPAEPLLGVVREAMRNEKALHLVYADEAGNETQRPVWPVTLAYYDEKQIIGAWCTLRQDFRNFRIDRIRDARIGAESFGKRRVILLKEWEAVWSARTRRDAAADSAS
ncbi:MAG: YafY family transcriptional regulator [Hyphomicrobiales bacterium]|nr:MAG: YafY family transcriptional regulator [Hyphomicrobiales bacterium]